MSANYDCTEPTSRAEKPTLPTSRKNIPKESGRYSYRQQLSEPTTEPSSMSTLTFRAGPSAPPSSLSWHQAAPLSHSPRARSPPSHNALLPGIQSILPQFFNDSTSEESSHRSEYPPIIEPSTTSRQPRTPLGYTASPPAAKRRRSWEEDRDLEARHHAVPRLSRPYHHESPSIYANENQAFFANIRQRDTLPAVSPESLSRRGSEFSNGPLHWTEMSDSARSSPRIRRHELPAIKTSPVGTTRDVDPSFSNHSSLPPFQHLAVASGPPPSFNEYSFASDGPHSHTYPPPSVATYRAPPPSHSSPFSYGYQQPRGQSYSGPSTYSMPPHVVPYSPSRYAGFPEPGYPYSAPVPGEGSGDHKQRKRRGNLPKETTDKLGRWFSANLAHPYPTEDQKQTLMRETGLAMNQISNWFINARRRRLPTLVNNAQAESNLTQARNQVGAPSKGAIPSEYRDALKGPRRESDGSGTVYDEEFDSRSRLAMQTMPKRGSV